MDWGEENEGWGLGGNKETVMIVQLQNLVSKPVVFFLIIAESFAEPGVSICIEVVRANSSIYSTAK